MNQIDYPGKDLESMSFAVNYNNWLVDMITPYLGRVTAEVGAGNGNITKLLIDKGISHLVAFEPSDKMYSIIKEELGGNPNLKLINDTFFNSVMFYENYFDSVLYLNDLQHIENDVEELLHIQQTLKPEGYLCIFVPALSWLFSKFDKSIGHFRRYENTKFRNCYHLLVTKSRKPIMLI